MAGVVLADQVKSLDWRTRKAVLIAPMPAPLVQEMLAKLNTLLR